MIQGHSTSYCSGTGKRTSRAEYWKPPFGCRSIGENHPDISCGKNNDRYPSEKWEAHTATELKLQGLEEPGREAGGAMLNITGMTGFIT